VEVDVTAVTVGLLFAGSPCTVDQQVGRVGEAVES
jgi:hypothetical protein